MSEPITWTAVAIAAVSGAGSWIKIIADARKSRGGNVATATGTGQVSVNVGDHVGGNGNGKGNAPMTAAEREMLQRHDREIAGQEREIKNVCETMNKIHVENREDHGKIFDKLEELRAGRA